jgi:hypothetical protein
MSNLPTGYDDDPDSSDESSGESPPERRRSWNATENEDLLENRAYGDVLQQTAAMGATQDMMVISQPPNINLNNINSYAYPDEVSSTIRIYLVDTGVNPNHNVSVAAKLKKKRLIHQGIHHPVQWRTTMDLGRSAKRCSCRSALRL